MRCASCQSENTKVLESRTHQDGRSIRRRRKCLKCDYRFTTYEKEETLQTRIQKKDGRFEDFSRDKILGALNIACQKRPITPEQLDQIVNKIERFIQDSGVRSVSTREIGDIIMEYLQEIDKVAYVRFASVYKDFKDAEQFIKELNELKRIHPRI